MQVSLEGLAARLGDGERSVGFAADEPLLRLDVAKLFQRPSVAGKVAVGEAEERFERCKVQALIDHEHRHDAEPGFAFKGFI